METTLRPPRCLVVAPNWVGDMVMALPVLDALASSERQVHVLARPHLHPLLHLSPAISGLVERAGTNAETVERLRHGGFEEAVLLPNSFRAAWLAYKAGIPSRWGYRSDGRSLLLRPAVHRPAGQRHQLHDYDRLLKRMGVAPVIGPPSLPLSGNQQEVGAAALAAALEEVGIESSTESPLVGLFPGAEFGPSKRWRPESFANAASALNRGHQAGQPILIAGPSERELAASVQQLADCQLPVAGPDLDLAGLAALLARLDVLITNDSGPMHLAAAVGTRCVAIFGPTSPRRTSPSGAGHHVLWAGRWCAPCFRRRCPLIRHRCMRDIGTSSVVDAAQRALSALLPNDPAALHPLRR